MGSVPRGPMLRSSGLRFLIVGLLALLMAIPLLFGADIIDSRADYSRQTQDDVGQDWGGPQVLSGPVLRVPVTKHLRLNETVTDPATGETTVIEREDLRDAPSLYIHPDRFDATLSFVTELRHRGLFEVPVYTATLEMEVDFALTGRDFDLDPTETAVWDRAEVLIGVSSNRSLRGVARLARGADTFELTARGDDQSGFLARVGDPRGGEGYHLSLGFNGAGALRIAPLGRESLVTITGDWPHPAFSGGFLPDSYEIAATGVSARWSIPHLATSLPRFGRESVEGRARMTQAFGLDFAQPNDFYQKSYRAARYGIMFIALSFLTVLLTDRRDGVPAHPVQYLLIGMAQAVFFLLLVAFAEQLGFALAYGIAAGATVVLITLYGVVGLSLGRRAAVLGVLLIALYGALYLILASADYALLIGACLAFAALAATMVVTRNEDWYGKLSRPAKPSVPRS